MATLALLTVPQKRQARQNQPSVNGYARDTSKKIKAVLKAKGESGRYLSTIPPYGYMKNPDDKKQWIVDEPAVQIVKRIFGLCLEGCGPTQIARLLEKDKILKPSACMFTLRK